MTIFDHYNNSNMFHYLFSSNNNNNDSNQHTNKLSLYQDSVTGAFGVFDPDTGLVHYGAQYGGFVMHRDTRWVFSPSENVVRNDSVAMGREPRTRTTSHANLGTGAVLTMPDGNGKEVS
jgi:hypothetical protein